MQLLVVVSKISRQLARVMRSWKFSLKKQEKKEDRNIVQYIQMLKRQGNIFNKKRAGIYTPLSTKDYRRIVLGEPLRKTKQVSMLQIADQKARN